jgi:hypothetical protein
MKTINKLVYAFLLITASLLNAQLPGDVTPTNPGGGGTGGSGSGAPPLKSPIDMYVIGLGIIAIMLIVFFTKKYSSKKA